MTILRYRAAAAAMVVASSLLSVTPVDAVAPAPDVQATTVTGACSGGPGLMSLRVAPSVAGENVEVQVTARDVQPGSLWAVSVSLATLNGRDKRFQRVAVDGRWAVATQFRAPVSPNDVILLVDAHQRGAAHQSCFLINAPVPAIGGTACDNPRRVVLMGAREQSDGSVVISIFLIGVRPDARWALSLSAIGAGSHQLVQFDDLASRRGFVRSRVVMQGVIDPRLRLVGHIESGGRCVIGLNPANVTAGDEPTVGDVFRATRRLI